MREGLHSRGGRLISLQIFSAIQTRILWPSAAIPTREPLGRALPRNRREPWTAFQILQFQLEIAIIAREKSNGRDNSLNLECCLPSLMSRSGLGQVVGQVLQSEIKYFFLIDAQCLLA